MRVGWVIPGPGLEVLTAPPHATLQCQYSRVRVQVCVVLNPRGCMNFSTELFSTADNFSFIRYEAILFLDLRDPRN